MKKLLLIFIIWFVVGTLIAQDKKDYDMNLMDKSTDDKITMSNNVFEMTLIRGGFFTIGTTQGMSALIGDDYNQITFGHPFALTSFPMIFADNAWLSLSTLINNYTQVLAKTQDTLSIYFSDSSRFEGSFMMIQQNLGNAMKFIFRLKNIDDVSHSLGLGFTFDPSLGNYGDGYVKLPSVYLQKDSILDSGIPSSFELWERDTFPRGIGMELFFSSGTPDTLIFANWNDLQDGSLTLQENLRWLYDLCLQARWNIQSLINGQEIEYTISINFLQPEFSTTPFLRWDFPTALAIEDSMQFPLDAKTYADVINSSVSTATGLTLSLIDSGLVQNWTSPAEFSVEGAQINTVEVPAMIYEFYNDTILEVFLRLDQFGTEKDLLKRRVYIPASPFSYQGLMVEIDSLSTADYPEIKVFFEARNTYNWQIINNLRKNNVFPAEDNTDISNFTLEKDTAGGVNQADIVIILDVTGSMSEEIADVRDNIIEFADNLIQNGIDVQLGMITFLDIIEGVYPLTSDIIGFQQNVALQYAHGGDDEPENSLEALHSGCQMNFRAQSHRIFIWITDATYHINNGNTPLTVNDVISELLYNEVKVYAIAPANLQTQWFDQIVLNTGGEFYDINGNFQDVLLEISYQTFMGVRLNIIPLEMHL
ncbi:MAG: VWA domain-containing protein [Bacteroidia bacterium]|nr:VWA domain-containing protein [Bacteroidia bacterium]